MPKVNVVDQSQAEIGDVVSFGTTSPGPNFLLCDGSTVSRTVYATLFSKIGTTFNTGGELGTEFRLPDMRGRSPIGAGPGIGLTNRAVGVYGGGETATFSNTPSHTHSGSTDNPGNHTHSYTRTDNGQVYATYSSPVVQAQGLTTYGSDGGHTHSFNSVTQGSGTAHNNMHPMLVVQFAIAFK